MHPCVAFIFQNFVKFTVLGPTPHHWIDGGEIWNGGVPTDLSIWYQV